jgi:hypothetical protein
VSVIFVLLAAAILPRPTRTLKRNRGEGARDDAGDAASVRA